MSSTETLDVGSLTAELRNVKLPMGLMVDRVLIRGSQLHLEKDPFKVEITQPGQIEATVTAEALAAFLELQAPAGLKNFQIEIRDQKVYVTAVKVMIVEMKAYAVAKIRIVNEKELFIDLESVDIMGAGAKNLVQSQLDKLNPVLNSSDLPFDARLQSVDADAGCLVMKGTIAP